MPIRVNCKYCDKQFSAWDDLVGKPVECPKCHQKMVVPKTPTAEPAKPSKAAEGVPTSRLIQPRQSTRKPVAVTPRPTRQPKAEAPKSANAPATKSAAKAPATVSDDEFDDSDALPIICPNCQAAMAVDDDLCDACGFHKILGKVIDLDGVARRESSTGLERVFKQQLAGDETPSAALLWFKILAGFMLITICMMCLSKWWWVGVGVLGVGYAVFHFRSKAAATQGSDVNQDPISAAIWRSLLIMQRAIGWRRLEWPLPQIPSLVIRDASFADDDLAALENLSDIRALDLEGTQVSNAGLVHLSELRQLEYLVLRRTQIDHAGLQRLQNSLRNTWIWD